MNVPISLFYQLLKPFLPLVLATLLALALGLTLWPAQMAWAATPIYVRPDGNDLNCDGTTNTPYLGGGPGACAFKTIQQGINLVDPAGAVMVAAGVYTENLTVNRHVAIIGAGSGSDPAGNTIIRKMSNSPVINITASGVSSAAPVLFKDLRVEPVKVYGFKVITHVQYLELDNVQVIGTNERTTNESEVGLWVDTYASLSYLKVVTSAFEHLDHGWYFAKNNSGDWGPGGSNVTNVYAANTSFSYNDAKGIYIEKLSNATFDGCIVNSNGLYTDTTKWLNAQWNAGFDINLKGQTTYQNLVFNNMVVTLNGLNVITNNTAGFMIKARDDAPSYNTYPAQLNNVQINNSIFSGNTRAIRFGEPGKNNSGPTQAMVVSSAITANTFGLINETRAVVSATQNWWNSPTGPTQAGNVGGAGDIISNTVNSITGTLFSPWLCDGTDTSPNIGFQPVTSTGCAIPTRLVFTTQPGNGTINVPLPTQPVVRAEDNNGNWGINLGGAITLTLVPGGAVLSGTNPVTAINGVASFSGLAVDTSGVYTFTAATNGLTDAASNAFVINQGNILNNLDVYLPIICKNN